MTIAGKSELFSLHYVSNSMCWCSLLARQWKIVKSFVTSIEPGQHAHLCSLIRLYTVGFFHSIFHQDVPLIACQRFKSIQQFAALFPYVIVFLESIIEALILLLKNKFTYIKTRVSSFELSLYMSSHMTSVDTTCIINLFQFDCETNNLVDYVNHMIYTCS